MAFEFEHPDDLGGDQLKVTGTYHMAVLHADENPQFKSGEKKGQLRDGFELEAEVLAGPQAKKTIRLFFRNPNLSHKDHGAFCRRVQGRCLEATGLVDPSKRGQKVTIELSHATGRQFIAVIGSRKGDDGKEYVELDGDQIYHVDDPSAPQCERNQAALAPNLYPAKFRRDPKSFAKADATAAAKSSTSGANGNGSTNGGQQSQQQSKQPVAAGAGAGGVDLNDL